MEKLLKQMVAAAQKDGSINTKNWDRMAVPSLNPNQPASDSSKLPQSVRNYIYRAYGSCKTKGQKDSMERSLKQLISTSQSDGSLHTKNWDSMPVPLVLDAPHSEQLELAQSIADKIGEPEKKKNKKNKKPKRDDSLLQMNEKRAARFGDVVVVAKKKKSKSNKFFTATPEFGEDGNFDLDSLRVVGTCENLEKKYLRLTSAPDPSTVRPVRVLKQTLDMLLNKWEAKSDYDASSVYLYVSEQFRSMRQDLTVQNVKTVFAVNVYEKNARIAIEMGDMHEFNACQTQLWSLYTFGDKEHTKNLEEFTSYRILYFEYTKNYIELGATYAHKNFLGLENDVINHAELVRRAVDDCNWVRFKLLYKNAPNMNRLFMKILLVNFRKRVLKNVLKSRMKAIPYQQVTKRLDFGIENDFVNMREFLEENLVVFKNNNEEVTVDIAKSLKKMSENH